MSGIGGWILGKVGAWVAKKSAAMIVDRIQEQGIRSGANEGKDLTQEGTFKTLVQKELQQLAETASKLPDSLRDSSIASWIGTDEFLEPFIWLLISSGDGHIHLEGPAYKFLEEQYELATGQTKKLASGPVALFASHVIGRLQQDNKKQSLDLAISRLLAAGFQAFFHPELRGAPTRFDLYRLRSFADNLVSTGRGRWKMPSFIAPFRLELRKKEHKKSEEGEETTGSSETTSSSEDLLVDGVLRGQKIVLAGEGGIGKTTLLLDLAAKVAERDASKGALFFDAAVWANSAKTIFEYLASQPAAMRLNLSASTLAWLAENGHIGLMVNGWNEIPPGRREQCQSDLDHLVSALPGVAVVVASRLSSDAGNIERAVEIDVRGISWKGLREVISAELDEPKAKSLIGELSMDPKLQHVARSPLILRGLIAQARRGIAGSKVIFDALEAVVNDVEVHAQKQSHFTSAPISSLQKYYLEALAIELSRKRTTYISRDEALQSFGSASPRTLPMLGAPVSLPNILEILSTHHLLHVQDNQVRFVHHRFQEYYCACSLKRVCEGEYDAALLKEAINEPFWKEALSLVAEKFKGSNGPSSARLTLVKTALEIDFSYGCDLIGESNFKEVDSSEVLQTVLKSIDNLFASPIHEVGTLAASCMIASRLPIFAPKLWELMEDESGEFQFGYRSPNASILAVSQLGADVKARVFTWDAQRQGEFLHEIVNNSDNFEFMLDVARTAPEKDVRVAALTTLLFNYVNSEAVVKAWLDADAEVQIVGSNLSAIKYVFEQGVEVSAIRGRINQLMCTSRSSKTRLNLLAEFESEISYFSIEDVLERLEKDVDLDEWVLFGLAEKYAPERLIEIAVGFALGSLRPPTWVNSVLSKLRDSVREQIFEEALKIVSGLGSRLHSEIIGPLANHKQINKLVREWSGGRNEWRSTGIADVSDYSKFLDEILSFVDGDILLDVVVELGSGSEYDSAADLVDLVRRRITDEASRYTHRSQWHPDESQFERLFKRFRYISEQSSNPSARLSIWLACIAVAVPGEDSNSSLTNALDDYLSAWASFRTRIENWATSRGGKRPSNPPYGLYLAGAFASNKFRSLPILIARADHSCADQIVFSALARIVAEPWQSMRSHWQSTVSSAIKEGAERREKALAFKMPTPEFQKEADQVALVLIDLLEKEHKEAAEECLADDQSKKSLRASNVLAYLRSMVNVPSGLVMGPIIDAVKSDSFEAWRVVDIFIGLLRQGYEINDAEVLRVLEETFQRHANKKWSSDDEKNGIRNLIEIMLSSPRLDLLSQPATYYIEQWRLFSYPRTLIDYLEYSGNANSWNLILESHRIYPDEIDHDAIFSALGSAFRLVHFDSLIYLIEVGPLLVWSGNGSSRSHFSSNIVDALQGAPEYLERLLDVLQRVSTSEGDVMISELLANSEFSVATTLKYGLAAVDAGRAGNADEAGYRILEGSLTERVEADEGYYEVYSRSCQLLRSEMYRRAKETDDGAVRLGARRLLARIESVRRQNGRPVDEPRHPSPTDGGSWTEVLT